MRTVFHRDDPNIPSGMAALSMDDNGWVGTNNGWPLMGQPALYPEDQAVAIAYAWNTYDLHPMPTPENVSSDVLSWLA